MNYDTDLFDEETIAELIAHLRALLEAVAAHPERRLLAIQLQPEGDPKLDAAPRADAAHLEDQFAF